MRFMVDPTHVGLKVGWDISFAAQNVDRGIDVIPGCGVCGGASTGYIGQYRVHR